MVKRRNPLDRWLEKTGITQTELARRVSAAYGYTVRPGVVCMWAGRAGGRVPSRPMREHIATATDGGVPVGAWR